MKGVKRVITHWSLLLHIYVSMAGFTLVLLFAVTGLTLNHQDFGWSVPDISTASMSVPPALLANPSESNLEQHFQQVLDLKSRVTAYHEDPEQIQVTFAAPGRRTVVTIDRPRATAEIERETRGLLGRLGDLHKGFDSGRVWFWTIDLAAVLLCVSSLTGMVTLISLRARRGSGFLAALLGIVVVGVIYFAFIPS